MSSVHLPPRLVQISRSFAATDGKAWVAIAIGVATAALIYAAFLLH